MNDLNPAKSMPLNSDGVEEAFKAMQAAMNNPNSPDSMTLKLGGANAGLTASQAAGLNPVIIKASPTQPLEVRLSDLPSAPSADAIDDLDHELDNIHELSNLYPLVALDHCLALMTSLNMKLLKQLAPVALEASEALTSKPNSDGKGRDAGKSLGRKIASICRLEESTAKLIAARAKVHDELERRIGKQ